MIVAELSQSKHVHHLALGRTHVYATNHETRTYRYSCFKATLTLFIFSARTVPSNYARRHSNVDKYLDFYRRWYVIPVPNALDNYVKVSFEGTEHHKLNCTLWHSDCIKELIQTSESSIKGIQYLSTSLLWAIYLRVAKKKSRIVLSQLKDASIFLFSRRCPCIRRKYKRNSAMTTFLNQNTCTFRTQQKRLVWEYAYSYGLFIDCRTDLIVGIGGDHNPRSRLDWCVLRRQ